MSEIKLTQSDRLKKIRLDYSINQAEFASIIGITSSMVSSLEKGKFNISPKVSRAVCTAFNVNEQYLLNGIGECYLNGKLNESLKGSFNGGKSSAIDLSFEQHRQLVNELNEKSEEIKRLWDLINRIIPANSQQLGKLLALKSLPKPFYLGADLGAANALPLAG